MKVKAQDGSIGKVIHVQEETGHKAKGYIVVFDDIPFPLFMSADSVEIVEEEEHDDK